MRRPALAVLAWSLSVTLAFVIHPPLKYKTYRQLKSKASKDDIEGDDWRTFRARLVQNGLPSGEEITTISDNSKPSYAYECTPLVEVGTVLVSVPTTDLCQALDQQFWHRCVVLITSVSKDPSKGEEETTVTEDQLAQGANRGRWSYRGVLLNRMTNIIDDEWGGASLMRGGDLASLDEEATTQYMCLHKLDSTDSEIAKASSPLVENLSCISVEDATSICQNTNINCQPTDFITYGGFCAWRPGQLEREMGAGRGEWVAISVDADFIWNEILLQQQKKASTAPGLIQAGTDMWRNFLHRIDRSESSAIDRIPVGQLSFYDRMLEIWTEENLCLDDDSGGGEEEELTQLLKGATNNIGSGTLIRATTPVSNDMLLYDQGFIRSLLLVLEETDDATVGILLNHPMSAAVECLENESPLPLRYGGPINVQAWKYGEYLYNDDDLESISDDEEGDDEMYEGFLDDGPSIPSIPDDENYDTYDEDEEDDDFIWIHRDQLLGAKGISDGGGSPLGISGLWTIKQNDAINALQTGVLSQKDIMVFSGVCIWEKGDDNTGGLREQIYALQSFEIVQGSCVDDGRGGSNNNAVQAVWDILTGRQSVLTKDSFESNAKAALDAWDSSSHHESKPDTFRQELSDAALRAWLGVNLLMDPLGTLVEIKSTPTEPAS